MRVSYVSGGEVGGKGRSGGKGEEVVLGLLGDKRLAIGQQCSL